MIYKKILDKAKQENISAISLLVAVEVDFQLNNYIYKGAFVVEKATQIYEEICAFVEYCYLKSERYSIEDIAYATCLLIVEEKRKLDKLSKADVYSKIGEL